MTTEPPENVGVNGSFGLTVVAEDASGNIATSFDGEVALALSNSAPGVALAGSLTVNAVNGLAAFSGLAINEIANGYTLGVSTNGLPQVTTAAIDVVQATPKVTLNPVIVTYGTPLDDDELEGTATWTVDGSMVTLPGSFTYTSAAGAAHRRRRRPGGIRDFLAYRFDRLWHGNHDSARRRVASSADDHGQ